MPSEAGAYPTATSRPGLPATADIVPAGWITVAGSHVRPSGDVQTPAVSPSGLVPALPTATSTAPIDTTSLVMSPGARWISQVTGPCVWASVDPGAAAAGSCRRDRRLGRAAVRGSRCSASARRQRRTEQEGCCRGPNWRLHEIPPIAGRPEARVRIPPGSETPLGEKRCNPDAGRSNSRVSRSGYP